jgi:hypothetical protein
MITSRGVTNELFLRNVSELAGLQGILWYLASGIIRCLEFDHAVYRAKLKILRCGNYVVVLTLCNRWHKRCEGWLLMVISITFFFFLQV